MKAVSASDDFLYVYALLETPRHAVRIPSTRLELMRCGPITAAVERRRRAPRRSARALLRQHRLVVQLHDTAGTVLPVRFGALVERGDLRRTIAQRRGTLLSSLRRLRGKAQMTVRIFGHASRPHAPRLSTSGAEYLKARAKLARHTTPPLARAVARAVRPLIVEERQEAGKGLVHVTLYHLVPQQRLEDYLRSMERVTGGLTEVTVSGPWPPFAFAPDLLE